MISIVQFEVAHLENFAVSEVHAGEPWDQCLTGTRRFVWTMFSEDKVICFFGFDVQWAGVCTLWAVIGTDFKQHGLSAGRILKRIIAKSMVETSTHRVQMYVKSNQPYLLKWASFLGFYHEAHLLGFGTDGSDYEMMARLL